MKMNNINWKIGDKCFFITRNEPYLGIIKDIKFYGEYDENLQKYICKSYKAKIEYLYKNNNYEAYDYEENITEMFRSKKSLFKKLNNIINEKINLNKLKVDYEYRIG